MFSYPRTTEGATHRMSKHYFDNRDECAGIGKKGVIGDTYFKSNTMGTFWPHLIERTAKAHCGDKRCLKGYHV